MITRKHIKEVYDEICKPIQEKLIERNLSRLDPLWREKYLVIKDQTWPDCNTMAEFAHLPAWIQEECINVHEFSPDIWKQAIVNDVTHSSIADEVHHGNKSRGYKILSANKDILLGKNIVDFSCHTGMYSFAALNLGANSVVAFDIRNEVLHVANLWKQIHQVPDDKLKFIKLDIHDYTGITDICTGKDTALIPGVMYHIHDHYQVLEAVAKSGVKHLLIETSEHNTNLVDSSEPNVAWGIEPSFELFGGWHDNQDLVAVGSPNGAWFKSITSLLGYTHLSTTRYQLSVSHDRNDDSFLRIRSVHRFELNK
jgi:2-polyprenyl-3-methyl-5-hydroxy-6-metoxy-1,4-benzoquinol methylase